MASVRIRDLPPEHRERARALKRKAEAQEREAFRDYCRGAGLPLPDPEARFHPKRKWRFDWAWPEQRIALEVEGGLFGTGEKCSACGQRSGGAHGAIKGRKRDLEKYNEAAALGWRVLRCTPEDLYAPGTLELLQRALSVPLP